MNRRSWLAINAWLASDLGLGFLSSAGEIFPNAPSNIMLTDPRPKAFIALSPFSSNGELETMRSNLRGILRPMLCITGSDDGDVVNNGATPAQRAAVFDALPRGRDAPSN